MIYNLTVKQALDTYIESNLRYVMLHKSETLAIIEIISNYRDNKGNRIYDDADNSISNPIIQILTYGQESGEFRNFNPNIMSQLIRSSIDVMSAKIALSEITDIDNLINEIIQTYNLAVMGEKI